MRLARPSGPGWSVVAVALVATLAGAPQALRSALEPEHRCHCPAGEHVCSCRSCAARASRAATAARPRHGSASSSPSANASGTRPPCHGPAAAAAPEKEPPQPSPDAPCLSAGCGGADAVAAQPGGVDPFVLRQERARVHAGRPERFAPVARFAAVHPSAPEPPPPRA